MDQFYVVRYPGQKFLPKAGDEPTSFLAEAKQFEDEPAAKKAAGNKAVGLSLYGHEKGKPVALSHASLKPAVAAKK